MTSPTAPGSVAAGGRADDASAPGRSAILGWGERHAAAPPKRRASLRWWALGAIVVAWGFGFGARAIWQARNADPPGATFRHERLLATADAYFYASGVQREVGGTLSANPRVPGAGDNIIVAIASGGVALFGGSIEATCLWLPPILAPLVAVPLVLLGLLFGRLAWGFLAALIAVIGYSYWNRTVPGYFDTDMVTIAYLLGVSALVIAAFWRRSTRPGAAAAMLMALAPWVHVGAESVLAGLALGSLGYALVFARREPFAPRVALLLVVAFLPVPFWARWVAIVGLALGLSRWPVRARYLVALTVGVVALDVGTSDAMELVLGALGLGGSGGSSPLTGVTFPGLGDSVAELADISVSGLGTRVAGHVALLVTGLAGYLLACLRFRPLLLLAPLVGLGTVFAMSGMRYTIFAVPVVALGNVWLLIVLGDLAVRWIRWRRLAIQVSVVVLGTIPSIALALQQAMTVAPTGALVAPEAQLLSGLAARVAPGDFVIAWWDYAYPVWYFAGANTVVDGAKQGDIWVVAEMLFTRSQREAAGLARLATDVRARNPAYKAVIDDVIAGWMAASGRPAAELVPALRAGTVPLPAPDRQVFLYLPWRLLTVAPIIAERRLAKGLVPAAELGESSLLVVESLEPTARSTSGWTWDVKQQRLTNRKGARLAIHRVTDVALNERGRVEVHEQLVAPDGRACVVNLRHSNLRLFMAREVYESVLAQLLLFGAADPAYFEPVAYAHGGAVFRVRP